MRRSFQLVVSLCLFPIVVSAQGRLCDGPSGVCFSSLSAQGASIGFAVPDGGSPNEFLGIITAPTSIGYIGISLAGPMTNSLLLVGWVDGQRGIVSSRYAEDYVPPSPYSGPRITIFPSPFSGKNGSQQRIVYRCQGCTSWKNGGSVNLLGMEIGWAVSTAAVSNPSDPNSSLRKHTQTGSGSISAARDSNYSAALARLSGGGGSAGSSPSASRATSSTPAAGVSSSSQGGRVVTTASQGGRTISTSNGAGRTTVGEATSTTIASQETETAAETSALSSTATDALTSLTDIGSMTSDIPLPIPTESSGATGNPALYPLVVILTLFGYLRLYV